MVEIVNMKNGQMPVDYNEDYGPEPSNRMSLAKSQKLKIQQ